MVITLSISNDRIVSSDQHIIGKTNENKSTILSINVGSLLGNKDLYLEFEKSNGEKYVSKPLELKDTIELMNSQDYKDRFKAEYWQAKIRYDKLDDMTVKYEANTLTFTPKCSLELLKEQKMYLGNYIRTLKIRAEIEGIEL